MEWMIAQVNRMGAVFVDVAVPTLVSSAALIAIVLSVEFLLRTRVRAVLRYWLVVSVLAYLLFIPLLSLNPPSTHWPAGNAVYAAQPSSSTSDPTFAAPAGHTDAPLSRPITGQSQTTTAGVGERPLHLTWQGAVFLFWLTGVLLVSGLLTSRALAGCRRIDGSPAANLLMNDILAYCRKRMGIHVPVHLKVSEKGTRPVVCGLLRPVIVVPRNLAPTLGSRHLRDVLFHELGHVKRHDLWVNFAQNILQVLYFYNPLLLVINAAIRRLREEATDETVLTTIGDADHSYARRLADVETIALKDPPRHLHLIGVA